MATNGQVHTEGKAGVAEEKCIIRNTARITSLTSPQKNPTAQTKKLRIRKDQKKATIAEVN